MTIKQIRILPPLAFARFGSSPDPVDNFTASVARDAPLGFRKLEGADTLVVQADGSVRVKPAAEVAARFKDDDGKVRPVAPFLEVFAVTDRDELVPLDLALLTAHGKRGEDGAPAPDAVSWKVRVGNHKVFRRTGDARDRVDATVDWFHDHEPKPIRGRCDNFVDGAFVTYGAVRYIRPTAGGDPRCTQIRLRFTPAEGRIYGPATGKPDPSVSGSAVYKPDGKWLGWPGTAEPGVAKPIETLPPTLFAISTAAPSWLSPDVTALSRGYLDDSCDGVVEVKLRLADGRTLEAKARIGSAPPSYIPDSVFVRTLDDDLDQVVHGPDAKHVAVPEARARALDIIRRAYETVRFMNVTVMNGNDFKGRPALAIDTMPAEEAFDTEHPIRPVMSPGSVDTAAVLALHQQVFAAVSGGAAPWFVRLLRKPDEVGDLTDKGRRKMPALMCGADNVYLALTHRQIDTITKAAENSLFEPLTTPSETPAAAGLTPVNLSAQIRHKAAGNPVSSRPEMAIANCCPGLEVDFRAVWRRLLEGIVLCEYDNIVVDAEARFAHLKGRRLLCVDKHPVVTRLTGPSPSNPDRATTVMWPANPNGVITMEWSNSLARILHEKQERSVHCFFTRDQDSAVQPLLPQPWDEGPDFDPASDEAAKKYVREELTVRRFFEAGTAVISEQLAAPGELTQGLCSPWQNDLRECSCYYWASSRPDYVNVDIAPDGVSRGGNWMEKRDDTKPAGDYLADDYRDTRLANYDDLFRGWEKLLKFQVGGRDDVDVKDG